jgi:hypothetical protein
MTAKFVSVEKRDALVKRLLELAAQMQHAWDQGHDGRIFVTDEMISDIKTAAGIIATAEIASNS